MGAIKTIAVVIDLLICLTLILVIVLQSGKTSGLSGALSGSTADTFLSKNKSKTFDARLARATKWLAGVFVVTTIILNLV